MGTAVEVIHQRLDFQHRAGAVLGLRGHIFQQATQGLLHLGQRLHHHAHFILPVAEFCRHFLRQIPISYGIEMAHRLLQGRCNVSGNEHPDGQPHDQSQNDDADKSLDGKVIILAEGLKEQLALGHIIRSQHCQIAGNDLGGGKILEYFGLILGTCSQTGDFLYLGLRDIQILASAPCRCG